MFSWFSDIIRNYSEYQNPRMRRILWNTAMTYKIGTKALSAILEAMKLVRSPPVDSCSEYHPNDYSNLEESKADGLSCSPIKVHVLIWQGFIDCVYLAYVVFAFILLCCTAIFLVYSSYMSRCHAHPLSIHIPSVIVPCFSTQMLFWCIRHQKGRG